MKFSTKPLRQNWSEKRREIQIKTSFIQKPYYVGILLNMAISRKYYAVLKIDLRNSKKWLENRNKRNSWELTVCSNNFGIWPRYSYYITDLNWVTIVTILQSHVLTKTHLLIKVSKSRKQFMVSSFLPKNKQKSLSWSSLLRIVSFVCFLGELTTP